jgi:hypothetical protein
MVFNATDNGKDDVQVLTCRLSDLSKHCRSVRPLKPSGFLSRAFCNLHLIKSGVLEASAAWTAR